MKKTFFIILFILLSVTLGVYFEYRKNSMVTEVLQAKTNQLKLSYGLLHRDFSNLSHMIFDTQINTKNVIDIFKQAYKANTEEKKLIRDKLYLQLKDKYTLLKHYNIRQLHFHLPNNESFLRFHRPKKFGDNLTNIRETVTYVNREKKQISGYEEGRIFGGYRFVYPLFDENNKHIGSVEISFSMLVIIREMIEYFHLSSNFIILKSVADKKVFKSEVSKYLPSTFNDYYLEKEIFDYVKKQLKIKKRKSLSKASKIYFHRYINKGNTFSLYDKKTSSIMTFIPIKNPVTKKVIGAVSIRSSGKYITNRTIEFYRYFALIIMFFALIFYIIYRELRFREKLQLNNNKLQTVIEEADSGIGVMDLMGNFLEVNQVYCDLLGYDREELLQLNCVKLTKHKDRKHAKNILEHAKKDAKISKAKKTCIKKDGSDIYLELSLTLLPSMKEFAAVINSLEETKQLEELNKNLWNKVREEVSKNREKEKTMLHQSRLAQMGEMISMIAHQWRQPLSAISATCADLETKIMFNKYEKELFQEKLGNISGYSQHLSKTIDDFRDFYKSNKEKRLILPEEIFNSALNIVGASIENKNIEIQKDFICNEDISTYPNELKQVVLNLIKNAEDALLEKDIKNPIIILKTLKDKKYISLIVSDNAGGVPEEIIDNIFDPYFTTKEKRDGTGLGLYMSKIIIEDHCKGLIEVKNSDLGAIFNIKIPLDSKDEK